jgi:5-methylcytosine-specific restriction endonuclease McrA
MPFKKGQPGGPGRPRKYPGEDAAERNRTSMRAASRRYREKNSEKCRSLVSEWYRANIERAKATIKRARQANPALAVIRQHRRRALFLACEGEYTQREWETLCALYDHRCLCCGKQGDLTVDHVIPLSKGGSNSIENIQPLCHSCNSSKRIKTTDYRR